MLLRYSYCILLILFFPLTVLSEKQECRFAREIEDHRKAVENRVVTSSDIRAHRRYIDFIQTLDEYDSYSQFELKADQDGKATLKFNTPEEQVRDKLKELVSFLSSAIADTLSNSEAVMESRKKVEMRFEQAQQSLKLFDEAEKFARSLEKANKYATAGFNKEKYETLGLGTKLEASIDKVFAEYKRLLDLRIQTLERTGRMADMSMCRVVYGAPLSLAKLYHFTIPYNSTCNEQEVIALKDRIRRITGITHGMLYEKGTYDRMRRVCSVSWERMKEQKTKAEPSPTFYRGSQSGGVGFMAEMEELDAATTEALNRSGPRRRDSK